MPINFKDFVSWFVASLFMQFNSTGVFVRKSVFWEYKLL